MNDKIYISIAIDSDTNTSFEISKNENLGNLCERIGNKYNLSERVRKNLEKYIQNYIKEDKEKEKEKKILTSKKIKDTVGRLYYESIREDKKKTEFKQKLREEKSREILSQYKFKPRISKGNIPLKKFQKIEDRLMQNGKKVEEKKQLKRIIKDIENRKIFEKKIAVNKSPNKSVNHSSFINEEKTLVQTHFGLIKNNLLDIKNETIVEEPIQKRNLNLANSNNFEAQNIQNSIKKSDIIKDIQLNTINSINQNRTLPQTSTFYNSQNENPREKNLLSLEEFDKSLKLENKEKRPSQKISNKTIGTYSENVQLKNYLEISPGYRKLSNSKKMSNLNSNGSPNYLTPQLSNQQSHFQQNSNHSGNVKTYKDQFLKTHKEIINSSFHNNANINNQKDENIIPDQMIRRNTQFKFNTVKVPSNELNTNLLKSESKKEEIEVERIEVIETEESKSIVELNQQLSEKNKETYLSNQSENKSNSKIKREKSQNPLQTKKNLNYKFKLCVNNFNSKFAERKDHLVDMYAKSIIHKKVKENYYERLKKLEYSFKPNISNENRLVNSYSRKETKQELFQRLTYSKRIEKVDSKLNKSSRSKLNKSSQILRRENYSGSPNIFKNVSTKLSTRYLNSEEDHTVKIRDAKQFQELKKSINIQQRKEKEMIFNSNLILCDNINKFKLNNLKEIFEKVYKNCSNIDDVSQIERFGIDTKVKEKLILPVFHIMKERDLDFNFQNFFLISNDIINYNIEMNIEDKKLNLNKTF